MSKSVLLTSNFTNLVCTSFTLSLFSCGGSSDSASSTMTAVTPPNNSVTSPSSLQEIADAASQSVDSVILYTQTADAPPQIVTSGHDARNSATPIQETALFKIASISKLYLAIAATKLANEGALNLNDTIATWLPHLIGRIENSESITIEHLIQHRSGIPDFDSQAGFSWQNPHTDIDDTLAFALDKPPDFLPDSRYEYSNSNYLLLAQIMNVALGFAHQQYIQNALLTPNSLNETYLQYTEDLDTRLISGYWENIDRKKQDYAIPGGSMIATVQDVGLFIRALNTGDLLAQEEKQLYAYWYNHSGWLPGYQSQANYYADIDTVVVQFIGSTGDGSEDVAQQSFQQVLTLLRQQ